MVEQTKKASVEKFYQQAAKRGEVEAQINLSIYYVLNNEKELAASWLEKAVAQGSLAAQYMSLVATANRDPVRLTAIAQQGYAAAQNLLGDLYYDHEIEDAADANFAFDYCHVDFSHDDHNTAIKALRSQENCLALKWYKLAAAQGDADALYSIGYMYTQGYGGKLNQTLANYYLEKAALKGQEEALRSLATRYETYCYIIDPRNDYPDLDEFEEVGEKECFKISEELDKLAAARGSIVSLLRQCYLRYREGHDLNGRAKEQAYDSALFFILEHDYTQYFKSTTLAARALYLRNKSWNKDQAQGQEQALEQLDQIHEYIRNSDLSQSLQSRLSVLLIFLQGLACYECLETISSAIALVAAMAKDKATKQATELAADAGTEAKEPSAKSSAEASTVHSKADASANAAAAASAGADASVATSVSVSASSNADAVDANVDVDVNADVNVDVDEDVATTSPAQSEFYLEKVLHVDEKFAPAKFFLGEICLLFYKNYAQARNWYNRAINKQASAALFRLGSIYELGLGVAVDYKKAFKFYSDSANKQFAPAQLALGRMYLFGKGIEQDFKQAQKWYGSAATKNFNPAKKYQAELALVKNATTPDELSEIEESLRLSFDNPDLIAYINHTMFRQVINELLEEHFEAEYSQLDEDYRNLEYRDLERKYTCLWDIQEYIKWFKPSALKGDAYAQYMLGLAYACDDPCYYNLARYWLSKAALQGISEAQAEIDSMLAYLDGSDSFADFDLETYEQVLRPVPECEIAEVLGEPIFGFIRGQNNQTVRAKLVIRNDRYVLLKGSNVDISRPIRERGSYDWLYPAMLNELRNKLMFEGKLVPQGDGGVVLTVDCEFDDAEAAAAFVLNDFGNHLSGKTETIWKLIGRQPLTQSVPQPEQKPESK